MSALRRSVVEDSQTIRRVGIYEAFHERALDNPDNYIFWIQLDMKGKFWLFAMKPSVRRGGPMSTQLRRPPDVSGRTGSVYVLTGDQWRVVQQLARSVPANWLP